MTRFKDALVVKYDQVVEYLKRQQHKPFSRNPKDIEEFKKATHCWICGGLLGRIKYMNMIM